MAYMLKRYDSYCVHASYRGKSLREKEMLHYVAGYSVPGASILAFAVIDLRQL